MDRVEPRFAFRSLDRLPEPQLDDDEMVSVGGPLADVIYVEVVSPRTLFVRFDDGVEGKVRFEPSHFRRAFAHLADPARFAEVSIAHGAVTWPGEIDLAPDAMHDEIAAHGEWVLN